MGKGSKTPPNQQVTQTTSNLPEYAQPYFENLLQRGQAESYRQYQPYEAERLAGFAPGQVAAQQETLGMQTPGQFGAATGLAGAGGLSSLGAGQQFFGMAQDPSTMQTLMSPYQQSVTDVARKAAIRDAQMAQQQINLGAVRQGTYGGARQALAQGERERGLLDRLAGLQAEGSQKAFEDARKTMQFGSDLGLRGVGQGIQAGQTLGQLGQTQQEADLRRLTAQEAVGGQQRGFEQQMLDQRYADFLRQRDYPLEQLGYYSSLLRGLPMTMGSTQTTYAPPPSMASQIGGLGLAGLSLSKLAGSGGLAEGGEVSSYAMGGGVMSPEKLAASTNNLSDDQLQTALRSTKPGSYENLMAAGELQARDNVRKAAMAKQGGQQPVIADLLTGGAMPQMAPEMQQQMPQQVAMLPENAGGVAALPAPNMDNMEPYTAAAGGMVAFDDGGSVARFDVGGGVSLTDVLRTLTMDERRFYQQTDRLPPRAQAMLTGQAPMPAAPTPGLGTAGTGPATVTTAADPNAPAQTPLPEGVRFYPGASRLLDGQAANVVPTTPAVAPPAVAPPAVAPPAGPDAAKPTVRLKEDDALAGLTAIKPPSYSDAMALGKQFAGDTKNIEKQLTELPTAEKSATEEFDLYKKMGVDLDPYKAYKEQLQKEKSEEGKAKTEAGLMRLAEFGFNWASQTGPTLQAAAKAGKEVSPGLMSDYKELNKLSRERNKTLADINAMDSKMRKDVTDAGIAKREKRRERLEGRLDQITDNAARISGTIYGQQVVSQTQMATTGMTTRATIANLEKQLSETEINNIVKTATDMLTKDQKYPFMSQEDKDTRLAELITVVNKARTAAGITVKPK
jgi:hypothetical protein